LDADFHALLALSKAASPSVIRVRIEGLSAKALAELLSSVIVICREDLISGAMVSVTETGVRVRRLPLVR
jgi:predicted nuclease of predicted toxin-antitoxin system